MPVKKEVKVVKKVTSKASHPERVKRAEGSKLSIPVYSMLGKESGTLDLPKEIFAAEVNKKLLAQAVRVYSTNQKSLTGFTKTRGEVVGSTAKMGAQKGSGHARHGSKRAPIFIGGGIVFGPKPRKVRLDMPKKMKKAALISALSSKLLDKNILGISGIDKATGKTKEMVQLMEKLKIKSGLIVTGDKTDSVVHAVRNIQGLDVLPANLINTYEVLKHGFLLVTKEAIEKLVSLRNKEQK